MISNWTVTTRQIRHFGIKYQYKKRHTENGRVTYERVKDSGKRIKNGFTKHVRYLHNQHAASHEYSKINIINNKASNIVDAIEARKKFRQTQSLRGAGIPNYATSFVVSLPRDIPQPNLSDWRKITSALLRDIARVNNLDIKTVLEHSHVVLHDESASSNKKSHVHILVSNVINNQFQKGITKKRTTHAVKMSVNKSVELLLNISNKDYIPINSKNKTKPLWFIRNAELEVFEVA
jgi:hypothetical protein